MRCLAFALVMACLGESTALAVQTKRPKASPAEKQAADQLRHRRLELLGTVCVEWHVAAAKLTPKQATQLDSSMKLLAADHAEQKWLRTVDFGVLIFAGNRAKAGRVLIDGRPWKVGDSEWKKARKRLLNEEQEQLTLAALAKREEYQVIHASRGLAGLLNQLVGLSKSEHELFAAHLAKAQGPQLLSRPFFIENIRHLGLLDDAFVRKLLGERGAVLRKLMNRTDPKLRRQRSSARFSVTAGATEEQRDAELRVATEKVEDEFRREVNTFIMLLARRHELSDRQIGILQTAAKGVRVRSRKEWKEAFRKSLLTYSKFLGDLPEGQSIQLPATMPQVELQSHPIWVRTLEKILAQKRAEPRPGVPVDEAVRAGLVSQVVVALDQELWLRPNQRSQIEELVDEAVSDTHVSDTDEQLKRVFATAVTALPRDAMAAILSPAQMRVFTYLRNPTREFTRP